MSSSKKQELEKAYDASKHEAGIFKLWEESGAFEPKGDPKKDPFCVIMPPPNANGSLHAGHLMYVIEDIATRYARMQDRPTLWLPGTDHAGIETQFVYEQILSKQNLTRHDLGQEKFYADVDKFVRGQQHNIVGQFKSMGFSADWNKIKFTLDDDITKIVYDTFARMHKDGLIYRGNRIVNWDPVTQSAYSDIEIAHLEQKGELYYLDYGTLTIATTRPETIFADTAVAVNSKDKRYKDLIGKTAIIPLINREIPIIADDHVESGFGTGALKVTPGHDRNDYEIGQRHSLPQITVIDFEGKMINVPEEFAGLSVADARKAVVKALNLQAKLEKTEKITHSVAIQDRSKAVIEPLITEQWFVRVSELNKPVIKAIEGGAIKFYPARFKKIALDWLKNEHDWCISRQIWWGIRIPVYYKVSDDASKDPYIIVSDEDAALKYYGKGNYRAETDTFDTWFSSGQWPYATLMATGDFERFYPTTTMATARDILHKWVTRMIMFGLYRTGKVPFENVYLWGLVTDEKGQKLSKSKGNYDDPMQITAKFGTDALRLALSIGITPGNDGKVSEEKIKGYRNFCNKLWNVSRYITSKTNESTPPSVAKLESPADHWMVLQLNSSIKSMTKDIEAYKFSEAGQTAYSLLWSELADKYLEYSKNSTNAPLLAYCLDTILRLLHPFAPFVTEAIWQNLLWTNSNLITEQWPNVIHKPSTAEAKQFELEIIKVLSSKQKEADSIELKKLQKELLLKQNMAKISESKLANANFVRNAPGQVVADEKARLASAKSQIKEIQGEISKLKKS